MSAEFFWEPDEIRPQPGRLKTCPTNYQPGRMRKVRSNHSRMEIRQPGKTFSASVISRQRQPALAQSS